MQCSPYETQRFLSFSLSEIKTWLWTLLSFRRHWVLKPIKYHPPYWLCSGENSLSRFHKVRPSACKNGAKFKNMFLPHPATSPRQQQKEIAVIIYTIRIFHSAVEPNRWLAPYLTLQSPRKWESFWIEIGQHNEAMYKKPNLFDFSGCKTWTIAYKQWPPTGRTLSGCATQWRMKFQSWRTKVTPRGWNWKTSRAR